MQRRGETADAFVIRDATVEDIPALARVHVTAWNATYNTSRGPTVELREQQWRETFARQDGNWFALVVVNGRGEIVGFARGHRRRDGTGDFNKLYLLSEYQWLGLGRRLAGHLVRRFRAMGVRSMSAFVDPGNPSCAFFERIGGRRGRDDRGRIDYWSFRWDDLDAVARACPVE
jgi:L-amino acid N-acyltransferase YncA